MPKVTWIGAKRHQPKPYRALAAVLRGYKLASGLTGPLEAFLYIYVLL